MRIGILGGGQLAQMLIQSKARQHNEFLVYTNTPAASTQNLVTQIVKDYNDEVSLKNFADQVDLITFETETIPVSTIENLQQYKPVYPNKNSLALFQDRLFEKQFFQDLNVPTNRFIAINHNSDLIKAAEYLGFPFVVKARRDGYDGKFQWYIHSEQELNKLLNSESIENCIAEEFIKFDKEVSIVGVRGQNGECKFYNLSENIHKQGILRYTIVKPQPELQTQAEQYLQKTLNELNYIGVCAIEFFVQGNKLLVNEAAPRVHNSGHWTIEGATTSQFSNHILAITNQSLDDCSAIGFAIMVNFIGDLTLKESLKDFDYTFHDYHKSPRSGRKLAHSTLVTQSENEFERVLQYLRECV